MKTGSIVLGDAERALVVDGGALVLVENPALIESTRRITWLGGCFAGVMAGVTIGLVGVSQWVAVARNALLSPIPAIAASVMSGLAIVCGVAATILVLRRKRVAITRRVVATLDPRTWLMRWEATGQCFSLDRVFLRVRVLPDALLAEEGRVCDRILAIPSLCVGPYSTMLSKQYAQVHPRAIALPPVFDRVIPMLHAWGIAVHIERPSLF